MKKKLINILFMIITIIIFKLFCTYSGFKIYISAILTLIISFVIALTLDLVMAHKK